MMLYTIFGGVLLTGGLVAVAVFLLAKEKSWIDVEIRDFPFDKNDITDSAKHMENIARMQDTFYIRKISGHIVGKCKREWSRLRTYHRIVRDTPEGILSLVPSAQWLIDNFYVINRETKTIIRNFSATPFTELPCMKEGPFKGWPRIYLLAREIVRVTEAHLNEDSIVALLNAYQTVRPLRISELRAFMDVLKICLIEVLENVCGNIAESITVKQKADRIMDDILRKPWHREEDIWQRFAHRIKRDEIKDPSFLVQILYRLKEIGVEEEFFNQCLVDAQCGDDFDISSVIRSEAGQQAAMQVKISSAITSLIHISAIDWDKLFEKVSPVESILLNDPSGVYSRMDFTTKYAYQREIETLARKIGISETKAAEKAVQLSLENYNKGIAGVLSHVGYHIMGKGKTLLERSFNYRPGIGERFRAWFKSYPGLVYFAGMLILTGTISALVLFYSLNSKPSGAGWLLYSLSMLFTIILSLTIAQETVNFIYARFTKPRRLPSMDFEKKIPDEFRTMVVMPVIIETKEHVAKYLQKMESCFLANRDKNLFFAILGDFKDAQSKEIPEDYDIIREGITQTESLNRKYASTSQGPFYFLLRSRKYNEKEGCWMGWERKRGKLEEFNRLLLGESNTSYSVIVGNTDIFASIKYVITIDADTELTRGSAARLIGMMAHPLNEPVLDASGKKVVGGYALLQPRIGIRAASINASFFSRLFAGQAGVDPYTNAVSDIYQDVFAEGTFAGKGIYNLRVFKRILAGTIPENTILSHDLLEGSYVRCALATDVELMDGYPSTVVTFFSREHRWVRGDWQLLPWLIGRDSLGGLSRWKIFDNLRRSFVAVSQLGVILLAELTMNWDFTVWIALVLFSTFFSIAVSIMDTVISRFRKCKNGELFLSNLFSTVATALLQGLVLFTLIPYRAHVNLDAIARALYRMFVSHRKMLEWKTAEAVEKMTSNSLATYLKKMWAGPLAGALLGVSAIGESRPAALAAAVVWLFSPFISYIISRPLDERRKVKLNREEIQEIRRLARKTWLYFEEFFTQQDNWLTPDNYQFYPGDVFARKTSPTNIGMQLLATLSAKDFGYISLTCFIERIEKVFSTLSRMEMWHGHLFNWYDTRTLEVLYPRYVSTVDSGNFTVGLIILKNALEEIRGMPVFGKAHYEGLIDTARLAGITVPSSLPANGREWKHMLESIKNEISKKDSRQEEQEWKVLLDKQCNDFLADLCNYGISDMEGPMPSVSEMAQENNSYANNILKRIELLISDMDSRIRNTDFKALYDPRRNLFRVGFNVTNNLPDNSFYDLLASESRLTSFIAIAKGDVPQKHWFKLGRPLTLINGKAVLISWSGTMFEYLLPTLVMRVFPGTLLEQTCRMAVKAQINYGQSRRIPWGISESGYFRFDQMLNYQYRAFGIPELGFKSDLKKSLVVAPYATLLAMSFEPVEVYKNIKLIQKLDAEGKYGFYEAIDFINPIMKNPRKYKLIQSFMIHHQGMSLVALDNYVNSSIMQKRFHREPMIRASELLLEERQPCGIVIGREATQTQKVSAASRLLQKRREPRIVRSTRVKYPVAHVLSNNRYTAMITSNGNSISTWNDIVVNRWRPVPNDENWGMFFYIKNTRTGKYWSATYLPTKVEPEVYRVLFASDRAEFKRMDGHIETRMEVVVSPKDDIEIRRIVLTNRGIEYADLEVTSYFEPVIDHYEADLAHPAFSKLFITTEYVEGKNMLIASRRTRKDGNNKEVLFSTVSVKGKMNGEIEYETDRNLFIGRGNTLKSPRVLRTDLPLSGSAGNVLDPVMSLRANVTVMPGRSTAITFITGVAETKEKAVELGTIYQNAHAIDDAFKMAFIDSEVEMQYLGITNQYANAIQDLVGSIYYPSRLLRAPSDIIENNRMGQPGLWRFGISGDYPIMLFRISDVNQIEALKEAVLGYEYLRRNGVRLDFVVLNEEESGYFQPLERQISDILSNRRIYYPHGKNPGIFLLKAANMSKEEVYLLLTVARIVLSWKNNVSARRIRQQLLEEMPAGMGKHAPYIRQYDNIKLSHEDLRMFNGVGGFSKDGSEYVIILKGEYNTPAPWINVIANESFGFIVSTSGAGYTWSVNSRENKITSYYGDPVIDMPSEIIYIRDDVTGEVFCPTPSPIREKEPYKIRHGFGYSVFEHASHGLVQNMTVFASLRDPVKIYRVRLENRSREQRELSLFFFVEWVMGVLREATAPYIVTDMDHGANLLYAKNTYSTDFRDRVAFISSNEKIISFTADRNDFLGIHGDLASPRGLLEGNLGELSGAGLDPCGAIKVSVKIGPSSIKEVVFILGEAKDYESAVFLAETYRRLQVAEVIQYRIKSSWRQILEMIQVETPDEAMNVLLNGWLIYQVISCRLRARSAFYQTGGAYGFRDQLQDVLALLHVAPHLCREHIIRCCARQFVDGDVQHWWHDDSGRGVRTRISDDMLWLPYVTAMYVDVTGDEGVLDETVPFLDGEKLEDKENEKYFIPSISDERGSVYEHCIRAIKKGMQLSDRGLPLMGTGDWNDGMNHVGWKGKGESVWLAWFLYKVLKDFIPICKSRGDDELALSWDKAADELAEAVEKNAWDGEWYIRAFDDNGHSLGSKHNSECRIDSIPQSWAVISGGANRERARKAMESVCKYLIKEEDQLALLLTPPFDKSPCDPGYIKGYPPGVRENGGQYTHAAVWNIIAFAQMEEGDMAWELFRMLNPLNHSRTYLEVMKYRAEPYVMPADIYSRFPNAGRGGWSWYTGSAGWMYQAGINYILGIRRKKDRLYLKPAVPADWSSYTVKYRYGTATYVIRVENTTQIKQGNVKFIVDGIEETGYGIALKDDGLLHNVIVTVKT